MSRNLADTARSAAVVPFAMEHLESFRDTLDVVARERRYLAMLEAPPLDQVRAFIENTAAQGSPRFVALAADDVVGWCDIVRLAFPVYAHRGSVGMGVLPDFRGRGLGFRLLAAALDAAWSADFTRVELTVYTDNLPAIALYEKAGFLREGIVKDAIRVDGRYRDAIAMAVVRRPGDGT